MDDDDDMRRNLLTNKKLPFKKLYEECMAKIQLIKQKNDYMDKQVGNEMDDKIKK
jgi:23S rRNA C2498 (ribose-2'-O)-methylase RlmM